jgi:arylsulfatase
VIETSGEGLCCGYDSGLPVTDDYRAPFRFTGRIHQVVVDLDTDGSAATDGDASLRAVLTDH